MAHFVSFEGHYCIIRLFNLSFKNPMILRCFWLTEIPFESGSLCVIYKMPADPSSPPLPSHHHQTERKEKHRPFNYSVLRHFPITSVHLDFLCCNSCLHGLIAGRSAYFCSLRNQVERCCQPSVTQVRIIY